MATILLKWIIVYRNHDPFLVSTFFLPSKSYDELVYSIKWAKNNHSDHLISAKNQEAASLNDLRGECR